MAGVRSWCPRTRCQQEAGREVTLGLSDSGTSCCPRVRGHLGVCRGSPSLGEEGQEKVLGRGRHGWAAAGREAS